MNSDHLFKYRTLYSDIDSDYPLRLGQGCMINKSATYPQWLFTGPVTEIDDETGIFATDYCVYFPIEVIDEKGE